MTPRIDRPVPGMRLRALARLFFDDHTMTRVVDPALADMQHEVAHAESDREARLARFRGSVAFWKLVVLSPFVFNDWPGRRQSVRSFTLVGALITLVIVAAGAESSWMTRLLSRIYPPLESRVVSVADVGPYVWMLTPALLAMLAVFSRRSPFRSPATVLLIGGATVVAAAAYGSAGLIKTFSEVGRSGSAGVGVVAGAADSLAFPTLFALGIVFAATIVLAVSHWRAQRDAWADSRLPPGSIGTNVLLPVTSVVVSLFVVDYWLRLNETLLDLMLMLANPVRAAAAGMNAQRLAARSELAVPVVVLGGALAIAMLIAALGAWRTTRATRNPLLIWTTRVAVIVVLAGCVWHGRAINSRWEAFPADITALVNR